MQFDITRYLSIFNFWEHSADKILIVSAQFHTIILHLLQKITDKITFWKIIPSCLRVKLESLIIDRSDDRDMPTTTSKQTVTDQTCVTNGSQPDQSPI